MYNKNYRGRGSFGSTNSDTNDSGTGLITDANCPPNLLHSKQWMLRAIS